VPVRWKKICTVVTKTFIFTVCTNPNLIFTIRTASNLNY
jgi:hypothetical protein